VSRVACLALLASVLTVTGADGSARATSPIPACSFDRLAFALTEPSPPMQSQAVGFVAHNTERTACRMALPVSLTLEDRPPRRLRVAPRVSRLTLIAGTLRSHARASVTWTYTNYCGSHDPAKGVILQTVRVGRIELRAHGDAPPCHSPTEPVDVRVLFACPSARGPAITVVLPRPLPLCPR
jgi:hypothetical protein